MLPKRKLMRLTLYPGVRSVRMIPAAMPSAQMTPITVSARCRSLSDTAAITQLIPTEKPSVVGRKGHPMKKARPMPP